MSKVDVVEILKKSEDTSCYLQESIVIDTFNVQKY